MSTTLEQCDQLRREIATSEDILTSAGFTDGELPARIREAVGSLQSATADLRRIETDVLAVMVKKLDERGFGRGMFIERLDRALEELDELRARGGVQKRVRRGFREGVQESMKIVLKQPYQTIHGHTDCVEEIEALLSEDEP